MNNQIHTHPKMEELKDIDPEHCIVDRDKVERKWQEFGDAYTDIMNLSKLRIAERVMLSVLWVDYPEWEEQKKKMCAIIARQISFLEKKVDPEPNDEPKRTDSTGTAGGNRPDMA
jgi:hypothetical protein